MSALEFELYDRESVRSFEGTVFVCVKVDDEIYEKHFEVMLLR